ncbi:hypothetical protein AB0B45_12090 [Nonomuraea sp. NPDC049152]|uniref:hypothetical protein n=1 Tax=Nonomuraea sp. NPDC049152 TaxID=3154350 RepID=UPI0033C32840
MAKHFTFVIACAAVLSTVIPGAAGYFSARMEAVEAAERRVAMLQVRLENKIEMVSLPRPCSPVPATRLKGGYPPPRAFVPAPETAGEQRARRQQSEPITPGVADEE